MTIPSAITDLSTTASSNPPTGSETPKEGDNHLRAAYSFIAQLRDKLNGTDSTTAVVVALAATLANVSTLNVSGTATVTTALVSSGTTALNGATTIGDAPGDTVTINANTASIPNGLRLNNGNLGISSTPMYPVDVKKNGVDTTVGWYTIASFLDGSSNKGMQIGYINGSQTTVLATGSTGSAAAWELWTYTGSAYAAKFSITGDGRIYGASLHNNVNSVTGTTNQYIASGTYTPTGTNVTNTSAITPSKAQWMRVGNVVTVSGAFTVTFTGATLACEAALSLPIASDFAATADCNGVAVNGIPLSGSALTDQMMNVTADATNNRAKFNIPSCQSAGANHFYTYTYQYEVL